MAINAPEVYGWRSLALPYNTESVFIANTKARLFNILPNIANLPIKTPYLELPILQTTTYCTKSIPEPFSSFYGCGVEAPHLNI